MIDVSQARLLFETKDTDYEFIGFDFNAAESGIIFRSLEPDNRPVVGEIRKIHQWQYYCYTTELALDDQTIAYWKPVSDIDSYVVFNELVGAIKKDWHRYEKTKQRRS